ATLTGHARAVRGLAFAAGGGKLASAGDDAAVKVWDVAGRQELLTPRGHTNPVGCLAFTPDGKFLASGGRGGPHPVLERGEGRRSAELRQRGGAVGALAFSPDGQTLASGGDSYPQGAARLWDRKLWQPAPDRDKPDEEAGKEKPAPPVAFAPDGKILARGQED